MASKYKIDDRVRYDGRIGVIDNIGFSEKHEQYLYIIRFGNGEKAKALESEITNVIIEEVRVTVEQFDEAVKALMYSVAADLGDTDELDGVLEIIGGVCTRLKVRLFEGND